MRFLPALLLLPAAAFAQDGCPPVRFASIPSAALLPTPSSHRVLAKQPDGSFTAYDLSNTSPYALLHTIPHFDQHLRPCIPYSTGLSFLDPTVAQMPGGGYLVALTPPQQGTVEVAAYDASFHVTGQTQLNLPSGGPVQVLFADLNHDGKLDAVIYTEPDYSNQAVVFLGQGGANFGEPMVTYLPDALDIADIAIADVDADGKPDLLGLSYSGGITPFVGLGNGDGTFQKFTILPATVDTASQAWLAVADLNSDGKPDLVISEELGFSEPVILVSLGQGNGLFAPATQYLVGSYGPVAIGDVNGDGFPDIATGNFSLLFGNGKGNFAGRRDYLPSDSRVPQGAGLVISDFNGDGIPDIVSAGGNSSVIAGDTATVLLGTGGGLFSALPAIPIFVPRPVSGIPSAWAAASGDFNNDGIPDLAVISSAGQLAVLLGAGGGEFTASFAFPTPSPQSVAAADFNHDGNLDIVIATGYPGSAMVFLGNGQGAFEGPVESTLTAGAVALLTGDFNRDGKPDIAVLTISTQSNDSASVQACLGNGDGAFAPCTSYSTGVAPAAFAAGDFTGDGKLDLIVASAGPFSGGYQDGSFLLLAGNGDGTFAPQAPFSALPPLTLGTSYRLEFVSLIAADFNRDGKLDLAYSTSSGFSILLGAGGGSFRSPVLYSGSGPLLAGDINGDGILDLVTSAGYRLGNGDGSFQASPGLGNIEPLLLADFNRDGKLDIAERYPFGLGVELNDSLPPPAVAMISAASFAPGPLQPGSFVTAYGKFSAGAPVTMEDSAGTQMPATVLYASTDQYNFQVPEGLDAGPAIVTFGSSGSAPIVLTPLAPQGFAVNTAGLAAAYATQLAASGAISIQAAFTVNNGVASPVPIDVASGQTWLTYFTIGTPGFSGTLPGGITTAYSGPAPGLLGVNQVNLRLPPSLAGAGYLPLTGDHAPIYIVIK